MSVDNTNNYIYIKNKFKELYGFNLSIESLEIIDSIQSKYIKSKLTKCENVLFPFLGHFKFSPCKFDLMKTYKDILINNPSLTRSERKKEYYELSRAIIKKHKLLKSSRHKELFKFSNIEISE